MKVMAGWNVTASEINQWTASHKREAQEVLPLLVRKLIVFSVDCRHIIIPAGDSILIGGWDGVLDVDNGNEFVPKGQSAWEFGTDQKIKSKADKDYWKRSRNPKGVLKHKTAFVFATSRTFAKRDDWVLKKNQRTKWNQVMALNADNIEAWLDQCPPVHRWFARLIGKRPTGAWDLEQAWDNWRCATRPLCNEELALGGRQKKAEELCHRLQNEPAVIRVFGESEEEAYAFILSALMKGKALSPRVLIVQDPREWDELIDSQQPLIMIPKLAQQRSFGHAAERGHHVVVPESSQLASTKEDSVNLGRARRDKQMAALIAMGLLEDVAKTIIHDTRGYLTVIRRHRLLAPQERQRPNWAKTEYAQSMVAAILAGSWRSDNEPDRIQLSRLAGIPYDKLESELHKRAVEDDPPVKLIGNVWQLISRQDAWNLLSGFINAAVLDKLEEVILDVFQESDPRFDLPAEERWLANIKGKFLRHSKELRRGLADAMAMLGAYGDTDCRNVGSMSMQDRVDGWVYKLFRDGATTDRWRSLSDLLPQFAEAAPELFLKSVEESLRVKNPPVVSLFEDQGDWGGCLHAGFLWALEVLSWNPDLLTRVALVLAKLSRLDPGGRWANRPAQSLKAIFLGWYPQTTAPLDVRMIIIDRVLEAEPEAGWQLLLRLLPETGKVISQPIRQPAFHLWAQNWNPTLDRKELFKHSEAIIDRLLGYAKLDPDNRWPDVIEVLPTLPKPFWERVLDKLELLQTKDFQVESRNRIENTLRDMVCKHRAFSHANWALPQKAVDRLETKYHEFECSDLIERHRYLFDKQFPKLIRPAQRLNYEETNALIEKERNAAIKDIWSSEREAGIERLAKEARYPWGLGITIAKTPFVNKIQNLLLGWLGDENSAMAACAEACVYQRVFTNKKWISKVKKQFADTWSHETWASFCLGVPFGKPAFDLLGELDAGVSEIYWKKIRGCYLREEDMDRAEWVLQQLLRHNRPLAAIDTAAQYLLVGARHRGLSSVVLATALEQAATDPSDKDAVQISYLTHDFVEVIGALQSAQDIERDRLARIEWMYIHIFRFRDIRPTNLITHLLEDPEFFLYLIRLMFKGEANEVGRETEPIKVRRQRAASALELIQLVDRIPGQGGEYVDEDKLKAWVRTVREGCIALDLLAMGDELIGQILSSSQNGSDGQWPHESVRRLLEVLDSEDLERGISNARFNNRGVTWGSSCAQDRELSTQYETMAQTFRNKWPRTSALLRQMAKNYRRVAEWEDRDRELRE